MKITELLADLREAVTLPTKGSLAKAILLLVGILLLAVGMSSLLHHFFPEEELERFADYGYSGVFLVTLISSLSIVLPLPGTVVVLAAAEVWDPFIVALVASLGGTLGELSAYAVGYGGRAFITKGQVEKYRAARRWMKRRGGFAIFLFALIPFLIFDFIGIAAGVFKYPLKKFLLFTWLGRFPRSIIEVYTYLWFGAPLIEWIFDHLPF